MSQKKIVILGGGVAGMSAAHELAERGFQVEVYERQADYVGGKARSVNVPDTNLQHADKFLPGEHGFRFFPGFYKHVTDTMKRIPYIWKNGEKNKQGVYSNLTKTTRILITRYGKPFIRSISSFPKSLKDIKLLIHDFHQGAAIGLTEAEEHFFATRIWQLCTSSYTRRNDDYEKLGWWEYMKAERFSETYQSLLVKGLTRTLVAANAHTASTKTGGNIFLQLIFNMASPEVRTDRVLNGPTNDQWLSPWLSYLTSLGVKFFHHHHVERLEVKKGKISGVAIRNNTGELIQATADYYLLAVPVERAAPLMNADILKLDPTLSSITTLSSSVSWMSGIQYYLNEDVKVNHGHVIYSDSEWALTSISQIQFWKDFDLSARYNGKVKGILSVDISDWQTTQFDGKLAEQCEPEEVKQKVWMQLKKSLNVEGNVILRDEMIEHWYLDRDIRWMPQETLDKNKEPLLVNTINSWSLRPESFTAIPNLFLASDYVRTFTDLATMEGANEAARRAVNGIIRDSGEPVSLCKIWPLKEPLVLAPLRWLDYQRWKKGLPWSEHIPFWLKACMLVWVVVCLVLIPFQLVKKVFN